MILGFLRYRVSEIHYTTLRASDGINRTYKLLTMTRSPTSTITPLLPHPVSARNTNHIDTSASDASPAPSVAYSPGVMILPLAFTSALAMAATAATSIFAYATLLCKSPKQCTDHERNVYAGGVAVSTAVANVCGLLAVGPLERLSRRSRRGGLGAWIVIRSMSVIALALGGMVFYHTRVCQGSRARAQEDRWDAD